MLKRLTQQIKSEWLENPRLQLGSIAIIIIFVLYLFLLISDQLLVLQNKQAKYAQDLEQIEMVAQQKSWDTHASGAKQHYLQLQQHLWQASSQGLAQAIIRNWLDEQATQQAIKIKNKQVELAVDVENVPDSWLVKAELIGEFDPATFNQFLYALENNPHKIIIDRLYITRLVRNEFTLQLSAYFQKP